MKFNINGKSFDVSSEGLTKAIENKTESIDVKSDFTIRNQEEETTYKENIQRESHGVGIEIGRKNVLKGLGIETEGGIHKSDDSSITALNSFISNKVASELESAKIEPNKKVEELQGNINLLKGTITTLTTEKATAVSEFSTYKKGLKLSDALISAIPDNTILPKKDMINVIGNQIKLDISDVGQVFAIGQDGQAIKNPTDASYMPIDSVVKNFFDSNQQYMKSTEGGAGGGDSGDKGSKMSVDKFIEEMDTQGIAPNSPEFNAELGIRQKAGLIDI